MCVSGSGKLIYSAMELIEVDNPSLGGVLPETRPTLGTHRYGELVDLISGIGVGSAEHRKKDILRRWVCKCGGEFHMPVSVVEAIDPFAGRVYDGCCGILVQVADFVEAHGGPSRRHPAYGQNS